MNTELTDLTTAALSIYAGAVVVANWITAFVSNRGEARWSLGKKIAVTLLDLAAMNILANRNDPSR